MKNRMHLHFYHRASINPKKETSVYLRVSIDGIRVFDHALGVKIVAAKWDDKMRCAKGHTEEANDVNEMIRLIKDKLHKYRNKCYEQQRAMSPVYIRQLINSPKSDATFLGIFKEYLLSPEHAMKSIGTRKTYESRYRTIERYLKKTKRLDLLCEDFNRSEVKKFRAWLSETCGEVYQVKIVQIVRMVLNYAVEEGHIEKSPLATLKLQAKYQKKLIFLTSQELKRVENAKIFNEAISRARDFYLFGCYTGLAYSDLVKFQPSMVEEWEGKRVLRIQRQKTDTGAFVPLSDKAEALIQKYPRGFPIPANPKMNIYVKAIAAAAGVDKPLTVHTARKTFAMTALNDWRMSMETVAKMMGHKNIKELNVYARVEEKRVMSEFASIPKL